MKNKRAVFYSCLLLSLLVLIMGIRNGNSLRIILAAGGFLAFLLLLFVNSRKAG